MLEVAEALRLVLDNIGRNVAIDVPLDEALACVLADDIASDVDSPPHDKAMVDGYALMAADLSDGAGELVMLEEVTAGALPTKTVTRGYCTRIMTGAPLPAGADAVVMVERTEVFNDENVGADSHPRTSRDSSPTGSPMGIGSYKIGDGVASYRIRITGTVRPGQHIMRRGATMRAGEVVLRAGQIIRPAEIGLLAEVGRAMAPVIAPVSVAILSTGNELIDAAQTPGLGQIRNSNGPMLAALVRKAGATPIQLGIARDDELELRRLIAAGLRADMLVLSGGVSAGVLDLVPGILKELGVEQVFHKVNLKPGKPLWFGVKSSSLKSQASSLKPQVPAPSPQSQAPGTDVSGSPVFGLPGNPIGSLVCFELFVRPAIEKLSGRDCSLPSRAQRGTLTADFQHRGDRPTYFPVIVQQSAREPAGDDGNAFTVQPVRWAGSADLRGFTAANALAIFPAGDRAWRAEEAIEFVML